MLTITSYLKEIFEDFKKHCDEETQSMKALRKQNRLTADDVRKVQMIIDRLEEEKTGFLVKELKCIADTEDVKKI
ncbi:hypothetical protein D7X48_14520 [bacterium D16-50]|nr:hypothetical protein D7X48_14520 [bacterium D16-50]